MPKTRPPKEYGMSPVETQFDSVSAALKQLHEAVASEQVPDDFLRILDEIDAKIAVRKLAQ
jgi:hypothetical protein